MVDIEFLVSLIPKPVLPVTFSEVPFGLATSILTLSWGCCPKWTELGIAQEGSPKLDGGREACRQGWGLWQIKNWDTQGVISVAKVKTGLQGSWSGFTQVEAVAGSCSQKDLFWLEMNL